MASALRDLARQAMPTSVTSDRPNFKPEYNNLDRESACTSNTPFGDSKSQHGSGSAVKNPECGAAAGTGDHPALSHLTMPNGAPVADHQHSLIAGEGYVLLQDSMLLNKLAQMNRERIPERVVHARGAGAFGYFEVTHDVTQWTKAAFLSKPGLRTPVFMRLSTVRGAREATESNRDVRGFSVKHFTSEGVYDMVGNNTPLFFVRDPSLFVDVIHAFKPNPRTGITNYDTVFDFCSLVPESAHQFLYLMGPRGIPAGYRFMNGYGAHAFKWVNDKGEHVWVKYHYKSEQGNKTYTQLEADALNDPNFATRDLFDAIASGESPAWTMYVQVIPAADVAKYKWNIFDVTKIVPHSDYPLHPVGRLVLDRNPTNYFAEVEQAAFSPANMVPGIESSPDRMLQARLFAYDDAARYRVGPNYSMLPINKPTIPVQNQHVDGLMNSTPNGGAGPNYYPNSISKCPFMSGGQAQLQSYMEKPFYINSMVSRNGYPQELIDRVNLDKDRKSENNDAMVDQDLYEQPRNFWNKVLNDKEKEATITNLCTAMVSIRPEVQERTIAWLSKVDQDLGKRLQNELKNTKITSQVLH